MRVVSYSSKLLNITAQVAYGTFYIFGILLSILFDTLLTEAPISKLPFFVEFSVN